MSSPGLNNDSSSTIFNRPNLERHTWLPCKSPTAWSISSHEEKNIVAKEWVSVVEKFPDGRRERRFFTASVNAAMRDGSVESK